MPHVIARELDRTALDAQLASLTALLPEHPPDVLQGLVDMFLDESDFICEAAAVENRTAAPWARPLRIRLPLSQRLLEASAAIGAPQR